MNNLTSLKTEDRKIPEFISLPFFNIKIINYTDKIDNEILGTGIVNYSAVDIRKIIGLKSSQIKDRLGYKPYDEVIHRDNLVITGESAL